MTATQDAMTATQDAMTATQDAPPKVETPFIVGMRDRYFNRLFEHFKRNRHFVMVVADNGAPSLDRFGDELPGQYYQVGIAEQQMIGFAAGLASEGKKVWCYALGPFVTSRVHEYVKLDVCAMRLPITLLPVGQGLAYSQMGPTHSSTKSTSMLRVMPHLTLYNPSDGVTSAAMADQTAASDGPQCVFFDRDGVPDLYAGESDLDWDAGMSDSLYDGDKGSVCLVATGIMTHQARRIAQRLTELTGGKERPRVIDVYRIKPFAEETFLGMVGPAKLVVTLEEHQEAGGLGGLVAETFCDHGAKVGLIRIGIQDRFNYTLGGREYVWKEHGLDVETVTNRVLARIAGA